MMKPLRVEEEDNLQVYACFHWRNFPPLHARLNKTPEELRKSGHLDEAQYQRYLIWQRECGVQEMQADKCLNCPHVRRLELKPHQVPMMWTLDGETSTPAVDIPSVASKGIYRRQDMKAFAREEAAKRSKGSNA